MKAEIKRLSGLVEGVLATLFYFVRVGAVGPFNLFNSILAGIAVFIGGFAFGHWVTNSDPAFLRILAKSERYCSSPPAPSSRRGFGPKVQDFVGAGSVASRRVVALEFPRRLIRWLGKPGKNDATKREPEPPQRELFQIDLARLIDPRHTLVRLGLAIDWPSFEQTLGGTYHPTQGAPGIARVAYNALVKLGTITLVK